MIRRFLRRLKLQKIQNPCGFVAGTRNLATSAVVLELPEERKLTLNPLLLRERCGATHSTGQRLFEICDVSDQVNVIDVFQVSDHEFSVDFQDGTTGLFHVADLLYDTDAKVCSLPQTQSWTAKDIELETLTISDPSNTGKISETLLTYGACLVKDVNPVEDEILQFIHQFGQVRETDWGRTFHVITQKDNSQHKSERLNADIAYTNAAIDLHVDNPYRRPMPGFWCLHCLQDAPENQQHPSSGMSMISDAFAAAEKVRSLDPQAFSILCQVPINFQYIAENELVLSQTRPHIKLDDNGDIDEVIFSGRLDSVPIDLSFQEANKYYKARKLFLSILRENALRFHLVPGDLIVLNNTRCHHGRSKIVPGSDDDIIVSEQEQKPRHLQGCYVELDAISSSYFLSRGATSFNFSQLPQEHARRSQLEKYKISAVYTADMNES